MPSFFINVKQMGTDNKSILKYYIVYTYKIYIDIFTYIYIICSDVLAALLLLYASFIGCVNVYKRTYSKDQRTYCHQ